MASRRDPELARILVHLIWFLIILFAMSICSCSVYLPVLPSIRVRAESADS